MTDRARRMGWHGQPDVTAAVEVWCPGCREVHRFKVDSEIRDGRGPIWDWNGDLVNPTFDPSLGVHDLRTDATPGYMCHSYVRNGCWEYQADCKHELAGQTVPLPPVSEWPNV